MEDCVVMGLDESSHSGIDAMAVRIGVAARKNQSTFIDRFETSQQFLQLRKRIPGECHGVERHQKKFRERGCRPR